MEDGNKPAKMTGSRRHVWKLVCCRWLWCSLQESNKRRCSFVAVSWSQGKRIANRCCYIESRPISRTQHEGPERSVWSETWVSHIIKTRLMKRRSTCNSIALIKSCTAQSVAASVGGRPVPRIPHRIAPSRPSLLPSSIFQNHCVWKLYEPLTAHSRNGPFARP